MIYLYFIIFIILFIIIITLILVGVNYQNCPYGYTNVNNVCKSNLGTKCSTNNDCISDLYCNKDKICVRLEKDQSTENTTHPNTHTNIKPINTHPNIKPYKFKIPQKYIKEDIKKDIKEDIKKDIKKDIREDIKKDIKKDIKEDIREDIKTDIKERPPSKMIVIRKKREYQEELSTDDEENSVGDKLDMPFDVKSQDTDEIHEMNGIYEMNNTNESYRTNVSIPYKENNGIYYCRNNKIDIISNTESSKVIDICTYSTTIIFLLEDNDIIVEKNLEVINIKESYENNKIIRYKKKNNVRLNRIITFKGYLYGLGGNNSLYILPNINFDSKYWGWDLVDWGSKNIKHVSNTYTNEYLFIQTKENIGYLYDNPNNVIEEINDMKYRRVYGRDDKNYIDINDDENSVIIQPSGNKIYDIYDAALSYYNELITITIEEKEKYKKVVIVNWKLYYISV